MLLFMLLAQTTANRSFSLLMVKLSVKRITVKFR